MHCGKALQCCAPCSQCLVTNPLAVFRHPQCVCSVQFVELAFTMYEQYYYYAAALYGLTLTCSFVSTKELYRKRVQLFKAVAQSHFIPLVSAGHVR